MAAEMERQAKSKIREGIVDSVLDRLSGSISDRQQIQASKFSRRNEANELR